MADGQLVSGGNRMWGLNLRSEIDPLNREFAAPKRAPLRSVIQRKDTIGLLH